MSKFNLIHRTFVIASGQSVVMLIEFIAVILLVRWLTPQDWAEFALVFTIYQTCRGVGRLNIQEGIYFFYGRIERRERRGLALQNSMLLLGSACLVAGVILTLEHWLPAVNENVASVLPLVALALIFELPTMSCQQILIAAERPSWASIFNASMSILQSGLMGLPLFLGWGLEVSIHGLLLYACIRAVTYCVLVLVAVPPGPLRVDVKLLWAQVTYTAPLALSIISIVLNRYIDKWIVAGLAPDDFGAYAFAAQELPFVSLVGYSMGTVLATRIAFAFKNHQLERTRQYFLAAASRGALIVGPVSIGVILLAPEAIALLFEPQYAIAIVPFQIYSVILLCRIMAYNMILSAAGRTKTLWLLTLLALATNTCFSLPLTAFLGIAGTALGTLLATVVGLLCFLYVMSRVMKTSLRRVYPWKRYAVILAIAVVAASLAAWLATFVDAPSAKLLIKALVFAGIYLSVSRLFRVAKSLPPIPEDDEAFVAAFDKAS